MPATLENTQVHAPVPNEWFEKYALPIEDADALEQDPDKDGFTNLDEWQGNTDPTKAESHPDYTTKLRLVSATEEPFPYIFASRTKDKFGINSIDESEPTQFLKVGDIIRGTDFKVLKFTEKKERNQYGMKMDVSELLLEHQQNHAQLTLVKGQVATSPQSVATFVYTWGGRKDFEVRKDQEFPLATAEGNRTYKLIDVHPDKAVIVNTQNPGALIEWSVLLPSSAETLQVVVAQLSRKSATERPFAVTPTLSLIFATSSPFTGPYEWCAVTTPPVTLVVSTTICRGSSSEAKAL